MAPAANPTPQRVSPIFIKVVTVIHRALFRLTNGAVGSQLGPGPSLLLTSTGRKSGRPRTCPLLYMRDGDNYVVVASYGGSPTHPAWWLNLQATPEATITVRDKNIDVRARESTGDERARLWPVLVDGYPGYGRYQLATPRKIPVVILEPA